MRMIDVSLREPLHITFGLSLLAIHYNSHHDGTLLKVSDHPHALHMRLVSSPYANLSFPLEGYVQTQPGAFGREKPGTLVIPVHPDHLHDRNLRGECCPSFSLAVETDEAYLFTWINVRC